jgi:DNA sulfur modification protein DndD
MILRKIDVTNFRQLMGINSIHFAQPGSRNVTVVLGQNGSGKTTLLNAFLWCFYERVDVENKDQLLCHRAVYVAAIGDDIPLEVSVVFTDGDNNYTVSRKGLYRKVDGGRIEEIRSPEFRIDVTDSDGNTSMAQDPKQIIQQILPDKLSRFFFFRGEEMESLALQSSGKDLAKGVSEFLNFTLLDQAIRHLKQVGSDFEAELSKIAVGDMKRLEDEITEAVQESETLESRLDNEQANVFELVKSRDSIELQLAEADEVRPYLERKSELKQKKADLRRQEEDNRRELAKVISRNGFLVKADTIFNAFSQLAAAAVKAGELPAKIKPRFVDDLLGAGRCVCGAMLDENARQQLVSWRGKVGLAALEESINLADKAVSVLTSRKKDFETDLASARIAWSMTKQEIGSVTGEISAVDSALEGKDFGLEYVQALQGKLRNINDELVHRSVAKKRTEDDLDQVRGKLDRLRDQRKRLAKDQSEAQIIERRFSATQKLTDTLSQLKSEWLSIVQGYLDGQLSENWKKVAQLDRLVEFTDSFQLSIKERGPDGMWVTSAPSSANLRALALCFVSALIKLAAEIGNDEINAGSRRHQPFQGGDYPIVMDAPFATMDSHFKRTVPSGLREVVPQMVLIINYDQWKGEVESVLKHAIGSANVLELHTPGGQGMDISVKFGIGNVDYVVGESDADTDWSIIRQVTL